MIVHRRVVAFLGISAAAAVVPVQAQFGHSCVAAP